MRWIWRGLCPGLPDDAAEGVHVDEREGREVRVRFTRLTPETLDELLPPADRAPVREQPTAEPGHQQPVLELGVLPAPRALPVSRLPRRSVAVVAVIALVFNRRQPSFNERPTISFMISVVPP